MAIYSPVDRLQPHRYKADESYQVGDESMNAVACYLDIESIIKVAKENEVDAIHPGYGFLSENANLARRCKEEGIIFVGPSAESISVRDTLGFWVADGHLGKLPVAEPMLAGPVGPN